MPVVTGSVSAVFSGILLVIAQIKPSGSTRFLDFNAAGSIIYYHGDRSATYTTAESFCKALGGRLPASIEELQTFTLTNAAYKIEEFWLGPVKQIGSIYMWPTGSHLNHYHFEYTKWQPQPLSCEYMCCAITGRVLTEESNYFVKPLAEVPCNTFRKPLCVITSPPGDTIETINETLKEYHTGYKKIVQKLGTFHADRGKLKIAFNSVRKDLDKNQDLWQQLAIDSPYVNATSVSDGKNVIKLPQEHIFTNEQTGRRFFFNGTLLNHVNAIDFCYKVNGRLVEAKDDSDGHFLKNLVGMFSMAWLGSINYPHLLERYRWLDGSRVTISFKEGYPKCKGSFCALAAYFDTKKGYLMDIENSNYASVICDVTGNKPEKLTSVDDRINALKDRLSLQRKAISELVKSFSKFISEAPAISPFFT